MLKFYMAGCSLSLLLWLCHIVKVVLVMNSIYSKNLKSIGYRISWLDGSPTETTIGLEFHWTLKFLGTLSIYILGIIFSWIGVFIFLCTYAYCIFVSLSAPNYVKEAKWRLKNLPLSDEKVIEEFSNIMKLSKEETNALLVERRHWVKELRNSREKCKLTPFEN